MAASPEDESPNTAGGSVDFATVLKQLGLTVLLPLIVGQVFQIMFTETCAKIKVKWRLSDVSSFCLLLMVWSVFSDAIHAGSFAAVSGKDIAIIAIMNLFFYVLFSLTCFVLSRLPYPKRLFGNVKWLDRLQYSREDTVAAMVKNSCIIFFRNTNLTRFLFFYYSFAVLQKPLQWGCH